MRLTDRRSFEGAERSARARRPSLLAVSRFTLDAGEHFGAHDHPEHQLVWAASGVLRVELGSDRFVLSSGQALWIPGGVQHQVGASGRADLRLHDFWPGSCPVEWRAPSVVAVTDLVAGLLDLLAARTTSADTVARTEALLFDVMETENVDAVPLRFPTDPRALDVANALAAHPADDRTLEMWGRTVGASERTLARLFAAETGLTFAAWRTRLRLRSSLDLLAAGTPLRTVAPRVGYVSSSSFAAAFRRTLGCTPASVYGR